jgi:hypothetical protein
VSVRLLRGGDEVDLGELDWADWDANGDLLFARDRVLYRLGRASLASVDAAVRVADLRPLRFTARRAPESALRW